MLSAFDDPFLEALATRGIRLLRASWLKQQEPGFRIKRRQDLEALEANGESPFLSPEEAIVLVCRSERLVGILTYGRHHIPPAVPCLPCLTRERFNTPHCCCAGWLTPGDPDPNGQRVEVVRRALDEYPYLEALFWE